MLTLQDTLIPDMRERKYILRDPGFLLNFGVLIPYALKLGIRGLYGLYLPN